MRELVLLVIPAEIVPASVAIADAALEAGGGRARIAWVSLPLGAGAIESHGNAVPESTLEALAGLDGWLLGPHDSAAYPEPHRSKLNPSGTIRKHVDLFANLRPAKGFENTEAIAPDTDLVIVRENTEGFYADRSTYRGTGEYMPTPDVAVAMGIITRPACERIARSAFEAGITAAIRAGVSTRDLGGSAGTGEFTAAVVDQIKRARAAA